jgi:hypothetical protein
MYGHIFSAQASTQNGGQNAVQDPGKGCRAARY